MNRHPDDDFRIRLGRPRQRGDTFIAQVLRQTGKAASAVGDKRGKRGHVPGARLGRGHVAARFAGQSLTAASRRVTVKVRLVYLQQRAGVSATLTGRVLAKGLADELHDRGYLVVDGRAHYVALAPRTDLAHYPIGAVVHVTGSVAVRAADRTIAALAQDGLYRTDHHLAAVQGQLPNRDPQEVVAAHVRRLEALRRAGIVERVAEGLWKVPDDLPEQGRRYDGDRLGGVAVEVR